MRHFDQGLIIQQKSNTDNSDRGPYLWPDVELWGGAIHQVPANATAFPHRAAVYNVGVLLMVPHDDPNAETVFQQEFHSVDRWWPKVAQHLTGSYINYPSVSLLENNNDNDYEYQYAHVYWGDNLPRLVRIKQRYDPDNIFRFPMSVPPA